MTWLRACAAGQQNRYKEEMEMKVVKMSEVPKEPFVSSLFTGADVTRQVLIPDSKEFNISIVNFGKGVRNKFHAHDGEQVLMVVTGGDVILIPAGEKHWHGATEDSEFSHIFVTRLGGKLTQLED